MKTSRIKKVLSIVMTGVVALGLAMCVTGCGTNQEDIPEENVDYEIALVTDDGLASEGGHSQSAWNSIPEFGATNGISHKIYKATEPTKAAFEDTIKTAINKGAKIVIVDNSDMEEAVYTMQEKYPEIDFLMMHAEPYDSETGDIKLTSNTAAMSFDSSQAGYLAGYAAVVEGYSRLGFIGENEKDEIKGFGYGYVKGANAAAREAGKIVSMQYEYCTDDDYEGICKKALDMYEAGAQVIFAAGVKVQDPVIDASENGTGKVIGSQTDQSAKSETVITSAIYNANDALKGVLKKYKDNQFPGGEVLVYNASNGGIGLEVKNNRLEVLVQKQYDAAVKSLEKGDVKVDVEKTESVKDILAPYVRIE